MEFVTPEAIGFSSERLDRIRPVMQAYVEKRKLPGLLTLVARQGKVVHFGKFGMADMELGRPMQADTIFRIYSMTKPITTVAAMMLYEEGYFQLSDPISRFVPEFKDVKVLQHSAYGATALVDLERAITFRDLMTHMSGLTYGFLEDSPVAAMYVDAGIFSRNRTLEENVRELVKLPLVHQPGAVWRYSVSTDVLGYLVEVISGMSFDAFLQQRIFAPLGMADTGFHTPTAKLDRFAAIYMRSKDSELVAMDPPMTGDYTTPPRNFSGGGGLVSTTADYLRFAQMLLNGGELDGIRLLGRKTVTLMTSNHIPAHALPLRFPDTTMYGYGFGLGGAVTMDVAETQNFESVGNFGWGGAASTHFWIDPQEALIGLIMTQFMPVNHYPIEPQFKTLTYQALVD